MSSSSLAAARARAIAAQQQVASADPPFATMACPGAGKTRVIVERHLTHPIAARQGRAITAFTRVAAAEVSRRCAAAGRLDLTSLPHFIGTIDTFLWLHLVRPFLPADRAWRRLESWRDAPASSAEFVCGRSYHLADADFSYNPATGRWQVRPAGAARRGQLPADWVWSASRARARLERAGYLTGAELRAHACRNLSSAASRIGAMLSAKYSELVIDEAQDCSAADLHILTQLLDAGLPLVLVADPDQAIYGFRGACTADLASLANRLGRQNLTHNWRSTVVICALTATLRTDPARRAPDVAVADHCDVAVPVLVYGSDDRDSATADFIAYAGKIGITPEDCLVLAHSRAGLPRAYGGGAAPPQPKAAALGWAVGIITEYPAAPSVTRNRAHDILARTALRWWYADADGQTVAECLAAHNIDPAAFERLLHRVVTAMPSLDQPMSTWVRAAGAALSRYPPFAGAARSRNRLTAAGQGSRRARTVAGLPSTTATGTGTRLSTIHQAKGDEADAVLLHMPAGPLSDRTLSAWLAGRPADAETAEAMRVLYVGLTRARKLLGISVPVIHRAGLVAHLHRHHIPAAMR